MKTFTSGRETAIELEENLDPMPEFKIPEERDEQSRNVISQKRASLWRYLYDLAS
jgi:hypothetical protein